MSSQLASRQVAVYSLTSPDGRSWAALTPIGASSILASIFRSAFVTSSTISDGVQPLNGVFDSSSGFLMMTWLGLKLLITLDGGGGLGRVSTVGVILAGFAGSFAAVTQDIGFEGIDGGDSVIPAILASRRSTRVEVLRASLSVSVTFLSRTVRSLVTTGDELTDPSMFCWLVTSSQASMSSSSALGDGKASNTSISVAQV